MRNRFILLAVALMVGSIAASAQRTGVREEVRGDWNKSSGLDALYDFSSKPSTAPPKGYEAVYISHYGRHGSRYAYTPKAYTVLLDMLSDGLKQDNLTPYGEELLKRMLPFWDRAAYRVGDLTTIGWEQHQKIAETMLKSFPSAFGKGSVVYACSSPSVRAIMSMSSFCSAVSRLAPQAEVYEHQGITDIQATRPNQGTNPFRYSGPSIPFPYRESSETFFLKRFPQYKDVLGRIFKDPDTCLGNRNPYNVFFNLYMFVAGMNSLPEKERVDTEGFFTVEEYATLWETDNYERFREYFDYRTPCSSIVDDMVDRSCEALASGQRGAHLRFGHDHVVMALLMIMDIDGFGHIPEKADDLVYYFHTFRSPMATNIQMVFFAPKKGRKGIPGQAGNDARAGNDVLVKVLLNGEEARLGDLVPVTGPYYRWDDLKTYLKGRVSLFVTRPESSGWTVTEIAPGLVYRQFSGVESTSGSAQQIFIADWDMSVPGLSFKYALASPGVTTSTVMREKGALVAMNASYETTSVVLKWNGEYTSCMPNNTVFSTPVPNWKSEGAIYTDGGRNVSISWEGKGKSIGELRTFYSNSTAPNIISSAPMLIDDYVPVGETFAGFLSESDLRHLEYEDPHRHQGVRHPRTAVAITGDNHLLMVVVDGRRPGLSEGMSARELTRFLKENFNPRYALNMDGGGSSTLCVSGHGDPETHVVNYPTDNKRYDHAGERRVPSHFYLVKE